MSPSSAASVWRRVRRALTPGGPAAPGPALSVIVPFYGVEQWIAACLESIREQSFEDFEVVLVDDGSPDGSRRIADEYAARDPRFRVVAQENGGLGAARNTGVREARGSHLTFVDSDDLLPPNALRRLMAQATQTGSDIVVGAVDRFTSERRWRPGWVPAVQGAAQTRIRVEDHPPLLRNLYTWDKVFRRDFWDAQGLWFREGVAYEDQPIITQLFARATSIDVIPDVVYLYRSREDRSSISQQTATVADLRARVLAWQVSRDTFRRELSADLYDAWLGTLFTTHFHWYLTSDGVEDDRYWEELVRAVRDFSDGAPRSVWERTRPAKRVQIELARQGRRTDLREFVHREASQTRKWPGTVRDDGVLLHLPFLGDPALDEDLFLLRPEQLDLVHSVERFAWSAGADGTVTARLSGWAYLAKVDLSRIAARTELVLRSRETGEEVVYDATGGPRAALPPPVDDDWCDYAPGTFGVEIPVTEVLARTHPADVWHAWIRVTAGALSVTHPLSRPLRHSAAAAPPPQPLPDGSRLVAEWSRRRPLALRRDESGVGVRDVDVQGRQLSGSLTGDGWGRADRVKVLVHGEIPETRARLGESGAFRVVLPDAEPPEPGQPRTWRVRIQHPDASASALVPPGPLPEHGGRLAPSTNRHGELVVTEWGVGAEVDELLAREDGTLLLRGRTHGPVTGIAVLVADPEGGPDGPVVDVVDGRFEASLVVREADETVDAADDDDAGEAGPTDDDHDVHAELRTGGPAPVAVPLRVSGALAAGLPTLLDLGGFDARAYVGPGSRLRVVAVSRS